VIEIILAVVQ